MAKRLKETQLASRAQRRALAPGTYWRSIDPEIHLGYRRGPVGGRWLVRWYVGNQRYAQAALGTADDVVAEGTLGFDAATKFAREKVIESRANARRAEEGPVETVRTAVERYVKMRDDRERQRKGKIVRSDASYKLSAHVLNDPALSDVELHRLSEKDLKSWLQRVAGRLKCSSLQRLVNDLKAALNVAFLEYRSQAPQDFIAVLKFGLTITTVVSDDAESGVRENQILTDDQVRRILSASRAIDEEGDFSLLLTVLAATGARFAQVRRMKVRDVQLDRSRLMVPPSWKGRGKQSGPNTPIRVTEDVLQCLTEAVSGRSLDEPLLLRWSHEQVSATVWRRSDRGPWSTASEMTRRWKAVIRAANLSDALVPYCLRHSSVVRGVRHGLPLRLIAASHDTSVSMIEKHYSRWITDDLENLAARAAISLAS